VKTIRLACAVLVLVAMGFVVGRATCSLSSIPLSTPCVASDVSAHLTHVRSVQDYGCQEGWAYLWATVGTSELHAIGVTEVLRYSSVEHAWYVVDRLKYCKPAVLPRYVYLRGCFSN